MWRHPRWGPPLRLLVAYLALVEGVLQFAFGRVAGLGIGLGDHPLPREVLLVGAVLGLLYGLVALGLILVYRANHIVNFAQAQLGSVPAVIALLLMTKRDWPYIAVLPIVVVGAALLGGVTEVAVVRRFTTAPRLILTVVTIGLGSLLLALEAFAKQWVGGSLVATASAGTVGTPFAGFNRRLGVATLSGDHLAVVVVGVVAMAGLAAFFRFTDVGIGVRAAAENTDRAALLGIPVHRLSTVVWALAAVLSALGVFLRAPLVGLPATGFVGPSILLFGLAAAVLARMENMPTALAAGAFVGMVQQAAVFSTGRAAWADAAMFAVVVVGLLVQRRHRARAFEAASLSWQSLREVRPMPRELRGLPAVRRGTAVAWAVAGAAALATPFVLGDDHTPEATTVVIYAMIGVSLVVLTGWAGQISLGQYAIAGVGAATAGGLAANHHWDFFATLLAGAAAGAAIAVVVGVPALRIQGLFLAVTTLAFAFAVQSLLNHEHVPWLLPQPGRFVNRPVLWGHIDLEAGADVGSLHLSPATLYYFVCVDLLAGVLAMARSLRVNRSGRVLLAVRDNSRAAQAYGIHPARNRLAAFAISGGIAGLAGALLAYQNRTIPVNGFPPERSLEIFALVVIGGAGSLLGAVVGALYVRGLPLLPGLRDIDQISLLTSGAGVVLVLSLLPGGLADGLYRLRDRWLRRVARRAS